ncbi:MAG: gamma-glutamyltransferase, partial [Nitrosomonas sp.]|nr:gamma-glutamyltransferase [Nitrosomonas sp.]
SRIISMLLLVILDYIDNAETDPQKLAVRPRFHHQYLPDVLQIEPDAFSAEWISALRSLGHEVQVMPRPWGNMQLIHLDRQSQTTTTANDPRGLSDTRY